MSHISEYEVENILIDRLESIGSVSYTHLAIWAHHGMFAAGFDFDLTFGLMHTAEKSAEILVKTLSMQPTKRQTITPDEFRHLADVYKRQILMNVQK